MSAQASSSNGKIKTYYSPTIGLYTVGGTPTPPNIISSLVQKIFGDVPTSKEVLGTLLGAFSFISIEAVCSKGFGGAWTAIKELVDGTHKSDPKILVETLNNMIASFQIAGEVVPDTVNPEAILESICPKKEFYMQINKVLGIENAPVYQFIRNSLETSYNVGVVIFVAPYIEEYLFRGILQTDLLKDEVKQLVGRVSPKHVEWIDTKVYTIFRVVITSLCFSLYHTIGSQLAQSDLEKQLIVTFFLGLACGALKEEKGLSLCVLAHMVNNFVAVYLASRMTC